MASSPNITQLATSHFVQQVTQLSLPLAGIIVTITAVHLHRCTLSGFTKRQWKQNFKKKLQQNCVKIGQKLRQIETLLNHYWRVDINDDLAAPFWIQTSHFLYSFYSSSLQKCCRLSATRWLLTSWTELGHKSNKIYKKKTWRLPPPNIF